MMTAVPFVPTLLDFGNDVVPMGKFPELDTDSPL